MLTCPYCAGPSLGWLDFNCHFQFLDSARIIERPAKNGSCHRCGANGGINYFNERSPGNPEWLRAGVGRKGLFMSISVPMRRCIRSSHRNEQERVRSRTLGYPNQLLESVIRKHFDNNLFRPYAFRCLMREVTRAGFTEKKKTIGGCSSRNAF